MNKESIKKELYDLIAEGNTIIVNETHGPGGCYVSSPSFCGWLSKIKTLVSSILTSDNEFRNRINQFNDKDSYTSNVKAVINILQSILEYEDKGMIHFCDMFNNNTKNDIANIFKNFHKIVRQLRSRYDGRPTLDVNDEYDVQDLLHSLLLLSYDDIRREEWTPSYAGKSARQDFLIKKEQIVIETKKTRNGLTGKELGDELIIDIARYKEHSDCKQLICFIYDPDGRISNPKGFISDIESQNKGFVKVYISPYEY